MKVFTYLDYLKVIEIREKKIISGIKTEENNNFGMLCLREDTEEYNIGQVDTEKNIISKKQINHPHDKIFRKVLEDKKQIIEVINDVLKLTRKLKESEIEIYNSSFITERFENKESDIVYKMKEKNETFLAKLMIIEKSESREELIKNLTKIVENEKGTENAKLLYRIINYVLREKLGNEMAKELLKKLKGGNENMGLAVMEMLEKEERELKKRIRKSCREAKRQGIEQGKSIGKEEGKIEVAKEMLKNNIEDAIIKKFTHIGEKELHELKEKMKC